MKKTARPRLLFLLVLLGTLPVACTARYSAPALTSDHPAQRDAATAPLPEPSRTLAIEPNTAQAANAAALYVCPMHAEVTSDKPDQQCPKCGMKLVKQTEGGDKR